MSKTYILEPTELSWNVEASQYNIKPQTSLFDVSLLNENVICEVSDGTLLKYAGEHDGHIFSIDGVVDEYGEAHGNFATYADDEEGVYLGYLIESKPTTPTVTVSIYTETEDDDSKPYIDEKLSKNVTYTDHPHNNWEEVLSKKGDPKTGYNTIEKLASSTSEGGSDEGSGSSDVKIMFINMTSEDGEVFTSDKTCQEVMDAIEDEYLVFVRFGTARYFISCVVDDYPNYPDKYVLCGETRNPNNNALTVYGVAETTESYFVIED